MALTDRPQVLVLKLRTMAAPSPGALGRPGSTLSVETEARVASQESGFSTWRWPSQPGKLPLYVQRAFAVKMFAVLAVQLLCCLALTLPVHSFSEAVHLMETLPNATQSTTLFAEPWRVRSQPFRWLSSTCLQGCHARESARDPFGHLLRPQCDLHDHAGHPVVGANQVGPLERLRSLARYPCNYFCATEPWSWWASSSASVMRCCWYSPLACRLFLIRHAMRIHMRLLCQVITTMCLDSTCWA